jgi:hypothetical protein
MIQHYTHQQHGAVPFSDAQENVHSRMCQPKDITILRFDLTDQERGALGKEIAAEIRAVQVQHQQQEQ